MIARPDGWSLVLAGFWNRSIFLPEWVFPRLFPQAEKPGHEVTTEVALLPALPLIYRDNQVAMDISSGRMAFRPLILSDECLLRCEAMARLMLQALPETPVHAVGINFGFRQQLPPGHAAAIFNDAVDDAELERQGWASSERKLSRKLTHGEDVLNLATTVNGETVDFDFNFNTEAGAGANDAAQRAVEEGRILKLRGTAIILLRETYHLEVESNDNGNSG